MIIDKLKCQKHLLPINHNFDVFKIKIIKTLIPNEIMLLNKLLENKTWYQIMDIDDNYYSFDEFIKILKTNVKLIKYYDIWTILTLPKLNKLNKINKKIPLNAQEYYRIHIIKN
jgi:hypothetical protein